MFAEVEWKPKPAILTLVVSLILLIALGRASPIQASESRPVDRMLLTVGDRQIMYGRTIDAATLS